jgi:hypothetical protein
MIRAFFLFFFLFCDIQILSQKIANLVKFTLEKEKFSKKNPIFGLKKQQILSKQKSLIMNLNICLFLAKFCHLGTHKRDLPTCEKIPQIHHILKGIYFFEIARFSSILHITSTFVGVSPKKKLPFRLTSSQIWLSPPVDDCQSTLAFFFSWLHIIILIARKGN